MFRISLIVVAVVVKTACQSASLTAGDESSDDVAALAVFEQRIMPIFRSTKPSSCVQCHLASVDLKQYILPSQEKTFVSLRDQGLINVDEPQNSKILDLIRMGEKDADEGARLIHQKARQAEYEAFAAWITASCNDSRLRDLPSLNNGAHAGPEVPDEVIRHSRKSRVMDSFVRIVWSQRMRCFPCHTPAEIDATDPKHAAAIKKQQEFAEQYPELVARMNLFRGTPEATLQALIERSLQTPDGQFPLINLESPQESLIVLKPMSKLPAKDESGQFLLPSSRDPVSHMGGLKMHANDQSYKAIVTWIQDYANVVGGRYTSVTELPADNWHATQFVLRLTSAPENWPIGTTVQMFVHALNPDTDTWESEPVAFTQGTVTPRRMVNGALILFRPTEEPDTADHHESPTMPRGAYLVKTYVDLDSRLAKDPTVLLNASDFVGEAEIKNARWREGFRSAESISAERFVELN